MFKKRRREVDPLIAEIMDKYNIENVLNLQSIMKDLLKDGVSGLLDSEMDETLGFSRHQRSSNKSNTRNGYNSKRVPIKIPSIS